MTEYRNLYSMLYVSNIVLFLKSLIVIEEVLKLDKDPNAKNISHKRKLKSSTSLSDSPDIS